MKLQTSFEEWLADALKKGAERELRRQSIKMNEQLFGLGGTDCCGRYTFKQPKIIKKVIYNDPATIVLWNDGTKTVVKCMEGDTYSKEMGLAMCICKKALGEKYHRVFREWVTYKPEPKSKYKVGDRVRFWDGDKSRIGTIVKDDGSGRMQYIVKEKGNNIFYCYESRKESLNDVWYIEGLADG